MRSVRRRVDPRYNNNRRWLRVALVILVVACAGLLFLDETILLHLYVTPVALYTLGSDRGFSHDCCLTNHFLRTIGRVELGCRMAREGDFVVLPEDLDEGGAFRTHFPVFPETAVEALEIAARDRLGCRLVRRSALPRGIRWVSYDYGRKFGAHPALQEWLATSMSLPPKLLPALESCGGDGFDGSLVPTVAVHMRVEEDWYGTNYSPDKRTPYCTMKKAQNGRHFCYSPSDIFNAIYNSRDVLSDTRRFSLLFGDVASRYEVGTREHPLEVAKSYFPGSSIFHKSVSNTCLERLRRLTYNERALVDLWIATNAADFVGTPDQSSMSDLIVRIRQYKGLDGFSYSLPERGEVKATSLKSCTAQPLECVLESANFIK